MRQPEHVIDDADRRKPRRAEVHFAHMPRQQLHQRMQHQPRRQPIGDVVGEHHHRDRGEGGGELGEVAEVDAAHRVEHQHAHGHERGAVGEAELLQRLDQRGEEQRERETPPRRTRPRTPAIASSTSGECRFPIFTGTPVPAVTMPVSFRPMKARNSPMPAAKLYLRLGEIALPSHPRKPMNVMIRKITPLTKTAPRRCCQVMPSAARPKAMNAFSPMYGATAIGRLAQTPMRNEPAAATTIVATVLAPVGSPAARRMAGLTTMMYAIARNVVVPPRSSVRVDACIGWRRV